MQSQAAQVARVPVTVIVLVIATRTVLRPAMKMLSNAVANSSTSRVPVTVIVVFIAARQAPMWGDHLQAGRGSASVAGSTVRKRWGTGVTGRRTLRVVMRRCHESRRGRALRVVRRRCHDRRRGRSRSHTCTTIAAMSSHSRRNRGHRWLQLPLRGIKAARAGRRRNTCRDLDTAGSLLALSLC